MSKTTKIIDVNTYVWECCNEANHWIVSKHWTEETWHVEHICDNSQHWTPNCQVESCESEQAAITRCKELNGI